MSGPEDKRPARDLRMETLGKVLTKELPLLVTAQRASGHHGRAAASPRSSTSEDRARRRGRELPGARPDQGREACRSSSIRRCARRGEETENLSHGDAGHAEEGRHPVGAAERLRELRAEDAVVLFEAAEAAANGLAFEDALSLITIDAARVLGVDKRVGSLEAGKDGDVALFDGDPFEFTSHVTGVVINGKVVSETPQIRLAGRLRAGRATLRFATPLVSALDPDHATGVHPGPGRRRTPPRSSRRARRAPPTRASTSCSTSPSARSRRSSTATSPSTSAASSTTASGSARDRRSPNDGGIRTALVERLKQIKAPVIRWPGGCFADSYDWRDGIGPRANRADAHELLGSTPRRRHRPAAVRPEQLRHGRVRALLPARRARSRTSPRTSAALPRARLLPVGRVLQLAGGHARRSPTPRGEGEPDPLNVRYWGVGNEPWGCGGDFTPEDYAAEFRRYTSWVPSLRPAARASSPPAPNSGDVEWTRRFFDKLTAEVQDGRTALWGFSVHHYAWNVSSGSTTDWNEGKGPRLGFTLEQ